MSHGSDTTAQTQRFNDAVRAFTPPSPTRHAKLMPLKEGIVELRQKGASLRLIRELLATVDVAVGTDTIARFLAEVNGDSPLQRSAKRSTRRRVDVAPSNTAAAALFSEPSPPVRSPVPAQQTEAPPDRSRGRGPRVADPRTL